MQLKTVYIENFRAITKLTINFSPAANILVGPNAVGKTTLLEAVRFNKALLAPRTQQESRSVITQLGLASAQLPQFLNFSAIAGDDTKQIVVDCAYELSEDEFRILPSLTAQLIDGVSRAQSGISQVDPSQMIQFLGSPAGQQIVSASASLVQEKLGSLAQSRQCNLNLTVNPQTGQFSGRDLFSQVLFSTIEGRLSPFKTIFSYFSADRAVPAGEIPIQLGAADAQQSLESHNSVPALKFQRFKNTLFSAFVENEQSRKDQNETFKQIFKVLLKEKEISEFSVNRFGQASIAIKDLRTERTFDIDSLSSGEKGLITIFLILAKAIERGGVVLIDEPELHLNPAVCKDILGFMCEQYLEPLAIQAIICTHSPEILTAAMRESNCSVHHMRQGGAVSIIRKQDQPEVAEALKLLGTSEVEEMLYDAIVFVEGTDDVELLEAAFPLWLSKIKFRELFGRAEIEKQIGKLQGAEKDGRKENVSYFLFDRDRKDTDLKSSDKVVVKQWGRYCLENYLLDPEILFDLLRREFRTSKTPQNLGEATERFAKVAKKQLQELVISEVYGQYAYESPGLRREDNKGKSFQDAATALSNRLSKARMQLALFDDNKWKTEFVAKCEATISQREQEWSTSWVTRCNGKQFLLDLYQECGLAIPPLVLKRRLLQENKFANEAKGTENWKLLQATFEDLFKKITD